MDLRARLAELVNEARRRSQALSSPNGEAILRALIDALPFVAFVANNDGRYVVANRMTSLVTGYSSQELRHMSVWDVTPSNVEHDTDILWRAFLQQREQIGEYVLLTKDGRAIRTAYAARAHVLPGLHLSLMNASP